MYLIVICNFSFTKLGSLRSILKVKIKPVLWQIRASACILYLPNRNFSFWCIYNIAWFRLPSAVNRVNIYISSSVRSYKYTPKCQKYQIVNLDNYWYSQVEFSAIGYDEENSAMRWIYCSLLVRQFFVGSDSHSASSKLKPGLTVEEVNVKGKTVG